MIITIISIYAWYRISVIRNRGKIHRTNAIRPDMLILHVAIPSSPLPVWNFYWETFSITKTTRTDPHSLPDVCLFCLETCMIESFFQIHPPCRISKVTPRVRRWNVDNNWIWPVDLAEGTHPPKYSGTRTTKGSRHPTGTRATSLRTCCPLLQKRRIITRDTDARYSISWAWNL